MKDIVFHCDLSTSDAFEVSVDGEMATKDQLAAILKTLNGHHLRRMIADMATEAMEQEKK